MQTFYVILTVLVILIILYLILEFQKPRKLNSLQRDKRIQKHLDTANDHLSMAAAIIQGIKNPSKQEEYDYNSIIAYRNCLTDVRDRYEPMIDYEASKWRKEVDLGKHNIKDLLT